MIINYIANPVMLIDTSKHYNFLVDAKFNYFYDAKLVKLHNTFDIEIKIYKTMLAFMCINCIYIYSNSNNLLCANIRILLRILLLSLFLFVK